MEMPNAEACAEAGSSDWIAASRQTFDIAEPTDSTAVASAAVGTPSQIAAPTTVRIDKAPRNRTVTCGRLKWIREPRALPRNVPTPPAAPTAARIVNCSSPESSLDDFATKAM